MQKALTQAAQEEGLIKPGGLLSFSSDLQTLKVEYQRSESWLNLSIHEGSLSDSLRALSYEQGLGIFALALASALGFLCFHLWRAIEEPSPFVVILLVAFSFFIFLLFWFGFSVMREAGSIVTDSVALGFPLKAWVPTGLPGSYSRSEVLAELHKTGADEQVPLQRRTDGWYVLKGTREGDWLKLHRRTILNAIKTSFNGDLSSEIAQSARSSRRNNHVIEGDDDVGLGGST